MGFKEHNFTYKYSKYAFVDVVWMLQPNLRKVTSEVPTYIHVKQYMYATPGMGINVTILSIIRITKRTFFGRQVRK